MANTEAPPTRRDTRGGSSYIAAGVAVLAVALFLGWLATRRPAETVAVAEPGQTTEQPGGATDAAQVTPEDLNNAARVRELYNQNVRVVNAEVVSTLGTQMFWLQLPGGSPFLVKLSDQLVQGGTAAPGSGVYTIDGQVLEKTNAVLDQWEQSGVLAGPDQRMLAEFGSAYIEARRLAPGGN
jgi:hypothetical protein